MGSVVSLTSLQLAMVFILFAVIIYYMASQRLTLKKTKQNESRLRDIASVASDWFWEMDEDLRFTYQSEKFEEVLGISISSVIGKKREEAFSGYIDDVEKWERHGKDLESRKPYSMVFKIKSNGKEKILETKAVPFYGVDGEFKGYRGIGRDVTEQKLSQYDLEYSEERFRDFATISTNYLWELDEELRFSYVSKRYEEIAGIPITNVLGKTREELWTERLQQPEQWKHHFDTLKSHKEFEPLEFNWTRDDGTVRQLQLHGKRLIIYGIFLM